MTSAQTSSTISYASANNHSKRKSVPVKACKAPALDCDKLIMGVFQLDVYEIYKTNPQMLLDRSIEPGPLIQKQIPNVAYDLSRYKETRNAPQVLWKKGTFTFNKGGVLRIPSDTEGYSLLTFEEVGICSTLRILPDQYLHIKETILVNVLKGQGPFKKRDAKAWFRIDVNKVF